MESEDPTWAREPGGVTWTLVLVRASEARIFQPLREAVSHPPGAPLGAPPSPARSCTGGGQGAGAGPWDKIHPPL